MNLFVYLMHAQCAYSNTKRFEVSGLLLYIMSMQLSTILWYFPLFVKIVCYELVFCLLKSKVMISLDKKRQFHTIKKCVTWNIIQSISRSKLLDSYTTMRHNNDMHLDKNTNICWWFLRSLNCRREHYLKYVLTIGK